MKIVFDKFVANPKLKNSFLEGFVKNLTYIEKYDDDIKRAAYRYTVPAETVNLQGSMHGGALSTLVDIVTTITILKSTPLRNASINLST
jgi:acyl-coenzyme A thioesterase 13